MTSPVVTGPFALGEALAERDQAALLRHLDEMESASMRVLDNLQKMGETAASDPSLLCNEHTHTH